MKVVFEMRNTTDRIQLNSSTTVDILKWYQVFITFNGSSKELKMYINGTLDNSMTVPNFGNLTDGTYSTKIATTGSTSASNYGYM